mgnify:CR=1
QARDFLTTTAFTSTTTHAPTTGNNFGGGGGSLSSVRADVHSLTLLLHAYLGKGPVTLASLQSPERIDATL